jgi:hypothetical protein
VIAILVGSGITKNHTSAADTVNITGDSDVSLPEKLQNFISDNETLHATFRNPDGVTRIKGTERVDIERPVVTGVTDRRIFLATPFDDGSGAVTLAYDEIASISVVDGTLALRTTDGIGIEWSLSAEDGASPSLCRHLRWIGDLRSRIRSCRNDVDLAAGEIRSLADDLAWEEALATYRETRARVDDLLNDVLATAPLAQPRLAPELTEIERTLEKAHTRLFIERGESRLELARQLLENGDYEQGRKVLRQAQNDHARAKQYREAVERGDAFQFGTQRSLEEDVKSLGWKLDSVAAEPIRQAHEAKIKAQAASDPAASLPHWERAFRRYGQVLTLEWGSDERDFAGDPARVRRDVDRAAARLVELHGARADACWNDGATHQEDGEAKAALRCCLDAQHHLERAYELAAEFRPDRVEPIASRLETMAEEVLRMRHETSTEPSESAEQSPESAPVAPEPGADAEDSEERALPAASELAEMDTHHEITLDADNLQIRSADDSPEATQEDEESEADATRNATENEPRRH